MFYLHEQTLKNITFFVDRSDQFKAWVCSLLKPLLITESQYVYQDEDDITHIFFLNAGKCSFVLPKHDQINYINIDVGATFGTIDIIGSILKHSEGYEMLNDWITHKDKMKRQFTVCSKDVKCELLAISIMDLWKMKNEFLENLIEAF